MFQKPSRLSSSGRGLASCLALLLIASTASGCSLASQQSGPPSVSLPAKAETQAPVEASEPSDATIAAAVLQGSQAELTPQQADILAAIASSRVIYLGETHDQVADHQAQLQIIRNLVEQGKTVAIALEMFQRPFQPVLDQYLAGQIDLDELRSQSEYDQRWGFPWGLYSPIFEYAKAEGLPLLAANTPRELTRKVARQGLESLEDDELQWIPPIDQINLDSPGYRAFVKNVFDSFHGHHGSGHGSGSSADSEKIFNNFFSAQVLWDETMAETVASFAKANPDHTVVMLAGQGHVIYGYGIPSRVERRLGSDLTHSMLLLNPSEQFRSEGEGKIADHFWFSRGAEQE